MFIISWVRPDKARIRLTEAGISDLAPGVAVSATGPSRPCSFLTLLASLWAVCVLCSALCFFSSRVQSPALAGNETRLPTYPLDDFIKVTSQTPGYVCVGCGGQKKNGNFCVIEGKIVVMGQILHNQKSCITQ